MTKEESYKEFIRMRIIYKKSTDRRTRKMAKMISKKIVKDHKLDEPPSKELFEKMKPLAYQPETFAEIIKRNVTREYGKMVYKAWMKINERQRTTPKSS